MVVLPQAPSTLTSEMESLISRLGWRLDPTIHLLLPPQHLSHHTQHFLTGSGRELWSSCLPDKDCAISQCHPPPLSLSTPSRHT